MTDQPDDSDAAKVQRPTHTNAPQGSPVPINEDNASDANDGVERPLGYFSSQAQADRNGSHPGLVQTNEVAGGPDFFSPEQQKARNTPRGATSPTPLHEGEPIAPGVDDDLIDGTDDQHQSTRGSHLTTRAGHID